MPSVTAKGSAHAEIPVRKRDVARLARGEIAFRQLPDAQLFVGGARASDPRQGNCLDCYFISALSAVAQANPRFIERKMFRQNRDGTYTVQFFKRLPDGTYKPEWVTVDGKVLLNREGKPVYARTSSGVPGEEESWPLIAEKAYAKWRGGFDVIGEGGMVEETLAEVTGEPTRLFYVAQTEPELLWRIMRRATEENWPATVCTYGRRSRPDLDRFGFHPWHIHIFLGCHVWCGHRIVWIRDPFDKPPAGTRNLPDPNGVFTVAWENFREYFAELVVNKQEVLEIKAPPYPATTILDALEQSFVFRRLGAKLLRQLGRDFTRVEVEEGQPVFTVGDPPDAYYLIRDGSAGVLVPGAKRGLKRVAVLGAGDQFGEMALINKTARDAEIRAITRLHLYRLSAKKFDEWLLRAPEFAARFRHRYEFLLRMQGLSKLMLTSLSLDTLLSAGTEVNAKPSQVLIRTGENAENFFIIFEGKCEAYVDLPDGTTKQLKVLEAGDLFGEAAALQHVARTANVRALTEAKLLSVDMRTTVAETMENFTALQRQLEFVAARRAKRRKQIERQQ